MNEHAGYAGACRLDGPPPLPAEHLRTAERPVRFGLNVHRDEVVQAEPTAPELLESSSDAE